MELEIDEGGDHRSIGPLHDRGRRAALLGERAHLLDDLFDSRGCSHGPLVLLQTAGHLHPGLALGDELHDAAIKVIDPGSDGFDVGRLGSHILRF